MLPGGLFFADIYFICLDFPHPYPVCSKVTVPRTNVNVNFTTNDDRSSSEIIHLLNDELIAVLHSTKAIIVHLYTP